MIQTRSSVIILIPLFCLFLTITIIYLGLPGLSQSDKKLLRLPRHLDDLKSLGLILSRIKTLFYWRVLFLIATSYIFLQSFMIPGSVVFSILLGYLFPFPLALLVISICSAVGASFCFTISGIVGENTIKKWFPNQIHQCQKLIFSYKNTMFVCITLLRICPFIPNWSVNIVSPILNVKLRPFFWGTFFGVIPLSLVFVKAGTVLQELTDIGVTSLTSVYTLGLFALVSLLPFLFRNSLKKLFD